MINTDDKAAPALVRKLWQYCNVLRDDGLSYPDYVEQLTYLLFLKLADERGEDLLPGDMDWSSFATLDATAMHERYGAVLKSLGSQPGILSLIFGDARNKIRDPAKLRLLVVDLVGETKWSDISADLKGDAYEGLLEKNARDTKSGAGQYFTPRPLVDAIVTCVDPHPRETVCDPACGTGGFLLAAHAHMASAKKLSAAERKRLRTHAIRGVELVPEVARLAAMNLFLHGVGSEPGDLPPTQRPMSC
jgi:type I restriction enzyme M protein